MGDGYIGGHRVGRMFYNQAFARRGDSLFGIEEGKHCK